MSKAIAMLGLVSLSVLLQVLVMIKGWGLEPKSWWWIVGIGVFASTVLRIAADRVEKEK